MAIFAVLPKYLVTLFLVTISSSSLAGATELDLFPALMMHPANGSLDTISQEINSHCLAARFTTITCERIAPESNDADFSSASEYLEDAVAITLHKDGDKIIWSLAPLLSTFTLNPKDDIKNIQVQLRYRF